MHTRRADKTPPPSQSEEDEPDTDSRLVKEMSEVSAITGNLILSQGPLGISERCFSVRYAVKSHIRALSGRSVYHSACQTNLRYSD